MRTYMHNLCMNKAGAAANATAAAAALRPLPPALRVAYSQPSQEDGPLPSHSATPHTSSAFVRGAGGAERLPASASTLTFWVDLPQSSLLQGPLTEGL